VRWKKVDRLIFFAIILNSDNIYRHSEKMSQDLSRLRQQIYQLQRKHAQLVQRMLKSRRMVKGSVVTLARQCGKPGCKCTRGEKHTSKYLSISEGGKTRMVYLKAGMEIKIGEAAERYRRFRSARSQLVKVQKELLDLFNRFEQIQREEPDGKEGKKKCKG